MLSTAHTDTTGRKLADVCRSLLLGADAMEEDDFASISLEAADVDDGIARYRKALCEGAGQACAAAPV